jgi:phasin family protein
MADMEEAVKSVASAQAPEEKAAKQVELLKAAYQHAVANMKEMSELIQKANAEALGLLSRRFSEGMDEVKSLMERFGSKPGREMSRRMLKFSGRRWPDNILRSHRILLNNRLARMLCLQLCER